MAKKKSTYEEVAQRLKELEQAETERKKVDLSRENETIRRRILVEQSRDGIVILDQNGKVVEANRRFTEMLGYTPEEVLQLHVWDWDTQWTSEQLLDMIGRVDEAGDHFETHHRRKDGTLYDVEISSNGAWCIGSKLVFCVCRDITLRKQMEAALRESEERLSLAIKGASLGLWEWNLKTGEIVRSQGWADLLGYTLEEAQDPGLRQRIMHPEDKERALELDLHYLKEKLSIEDQEYRLRAKSGEYVWVHARGKVVETDEDGSPLRVAGTILDVTHHKKAEEKLRESEDKFRALIEQAPLVFEVYDSDGFQVQVNPAYEKLWNIRAEDSLFRYNLKTDPQVVQRGLKKYVDKAYSGEAVTIPDYEFDPRIGGYDTSRKRWLRTRVYPIVNSAGEVKNIVVLHEDVTESKQAEADLGEAHSLLKSLTDSVNDLIFYKDKDGVYLGCNEAFTEFVGRGEEQILGKTDYDLFFREIAEFFRANDLKMFQEGKPRRNEEWVDYPNGRRVLLDTLKTPYYGLDGELLGLIGISRDITELKQLEAEQIKDSKLESIGLLAGGIAHDFNNFLTSILGNLALANIYTDEDINKTRELLAEAEKSSLRAKDLTQQLLTFSKGGVPVKKLFCVKEILTNTVSFALRGSNVKVEFELPSEPCVVDADEGQFSQVINNIVINALQAMPNGGRLKVEVDNIVIDRVDILPLAQGRYVRISIKDQGIGIPQEDLQRIFDPYFTTKQKGSGLGLATCYSIIRRHGGHIAVESELGVGSTFNLYLAAATGTIEKIIKEKKDIEVTIGCVLIMDDEPEIRRVVTSMLKRIGHDVVVASDGDEAVSLYGEALETGRGIDAVILDLTIPGGMGGKEAVKRLLEMDPDVKAIVSSGYSNDAVMANFREYGFVGVISKPYRMADLEQVLHEVMKKVRN